MIKRQIIITGLALLFTGNGFAATFSKPTAAIRANGSFVLTAFELRDIGRGSGLALALQTPSGQTYIYDAGLSATHCTDSDAPRQRPAILIDWDTGRDAILPFLKDEKVSEIAGIVIGHPHSDHYGGAFYLMQNIGVRTLIDNGYSNVGMSSEYRSLRALVQKHGGNHRTARAGDRLDWGAGLDVEVLWPPQNLVTEKEIDLVNAIQTKLASSNESPPHFFPNANSLVLRIRHGKNVFLLPGDLPLLGTEQLLQAITAEKLRTTVLVAPGHGIRPQAKLAAAANPEIVVVSSLPRYSNPNAAKVYGTEFGARVYFTYRHGRVRVVSDGERITVTTERQPEKSRTQ